MNYVVGTTYDLVVVVNKMMFKTENILEYLRAMLTYLYLRTMRILILTYTYE
jgi:hypothetical protein